MPRQKNSQIQPPGAGRDDEGLIWITEAMIVYDHSRGWFNRRIADGELEVVHLPGTTKVYLKRAEIERAIDQDPYARDRNAKSQGAVA